MRFRWLGASVVGGLSFAVASTVGGCSHAAPKGDGVEEHGPGTRSASTTQAIQGGSDDGANHPYVVGLCAGGGKGNCSGLCTGTLILPNVVVTARHCVDDVPKEIDCKANPPIRFGPSEAVNWITTNSKVFQSTLGWHHVKNILVPGDDRVCGNDIALIILDSPIDPSEASPIIPGVQYPMGDIDRYAHNYTAIGYGKIGASDPPQSARCFTSASDYAQCPGARRIRERIPLLCIPNDEYIGCPTNLELNENEFIGGDGTCEGDSGSSAFETDSFRKGTPVSFGVLSRGGKSDDGLTCKQAAYTRLDKWRDFVVQGAATASNNWTLYPKPVPDWTVYVPPPPDAGAPEAGKPKKQAFGVACGANEECTSNLCVDIGGTKACSETCNDTSPCYEGFVCQANVCVTDVAPPPAAAASSTTTTSGCSVGRAGSAPSDAPSRGPAIVVALGLVLATRRVKTRQPSEKR